MKLELLIYLLVVVTVICLLYHSYRRENFASSGFRYTFIKYYAPWCGFCRRLEPEWRKLKYHYRHKVGFAEYNCDIQKKICSQHDVIGYPTLKIRDNVTKKYLPYDGPREYRAMAAFLDTVIGR